MSQLSSTRPAGRLWLEKEARGFLGQGRAELLEHIDTLGSMAKAARAMGMGYKRAWDMIEAMNNLADAPLVERVSGGRGGGGTRLTDHGRHMIAEFRAAEAAYVRFLDLLAAESGDPERLRALIGRMAMKTSARNQWWGRVMRLQSGPVNTEVALQLSGGETLVGVITNHSADELGLSEGKDVMALVKATHIILAGGEDGQHTSARNRLCGTVERVEHGEVEAGVTLRLPGGGTVSAVVTNESADDLGLREGAAACALIKASHVILAVNG
ncbi:TOBE domain-containing protein [Thiohalorhabdus sp. Cl-TMA]|uniref:TOBE domain-containing protein n=1 Tax=Thiohalorhabdus methylotrophus TaxID=3242694 RepID=A0ABV4TSD5_9GAMM